jgi:hypothetical protein
MMAVCPRARRARVSDLEGTLREALTCGFAHVDKEAISDCAQRARFARVADLQVRARAHTRAQQESGGLAHRVCVLDTHGGARDRPPSDVTYGLTPKPIELLGAWYCAGHDRRRSGIDRATPTGGRAAVLDLCA